MAEPAAAVPADRAFTVANYPVEAVAENAVAAKEKALASGQEAAFRSLLKRIVPVTAYRQLERLKGLKAAEIVDGVRVRSERNSTTSYIASLDFSFQAEAVRATLRREGIPFVDEVAPQAVLVPVLQGTSAPGEQGGTASFRPATGAWANTWASLDLENTLTPVRVTPLRPEIHSDTIAMAMGATGDAGRILAGEYRADLVVLAIADIDLPGNRLNVTLAGRDAVGEISWRRSYRIYDGDVDYAIEFASVVSLGVLEGRWKALKSGATAPAMGVTFGGGEDVTLDIQYTTSDEWDDLRFLLLDLPGIDDVRVLSVSASRAEVAVKYPGGGPSLAGALAGKGVSLSQGAGYWVMRSRL